MKGGRDTVDSAIGSIKEEGITKVGIMGGSFDPIHIAHLIVAESALEAFGLEKIIFIPTGNPPHKDSSKMSDAKNRLEMTKLATQSNSRFRVSTIEVYQGKVSYTIDTIAALQSHWGKEVSCYFIIGIDALIEIESWKAYEELLKSITMVVATRAGHVGNFIDTTIASLKENHHANILPMTIPDIEVSSTEIRKRVKENHSIKYLVPESVENYIKKNKLYRVSDQGGDTCE
ncbi:nicotinate (nicotinamide) nucleotide adenylyltransferase [Alkaliphilus metalliredigens QYMF]|uniref:Probable nicotinate-nucleotide adenylyltransferase n=1 Tax=Alkaliphilus metalliredigens (strain QYMF) TaxID=293826 RepID=A6TQJ8_ALKMQ|nr:nicotinate (nicotinamide) nucleotide adenylyltransferase [Alkaliphilus metalliredigens QYMF]